MVKAITKSKKELVEELGDGVQETLDPGLTRAFDKADQTVDKKLIDPKNVQLLENKFRVSGDGVFYTVQGEGETMGRPCVFLRLHVCNLKCVWCDAWYTWNPKTPEFWTESKLWGIEETKAKLEEQWNSYCVDKDLTPRVVITGGEPMLHKDRIDKLMQIMPDWYFEIETNGTIMPTDYMIQEATQLWNNERSEKLPLAQKDTRLRYNCSPKLNNSGNLVQARKKPEVIQQLIKLNTIFKFVVMHDEDLDEISKEWIEEIGIPVEMMCLMPQGVTSAEVQKNMRHIVEYAKNKGYRLLGRLQNDIWGARRGV